MAGIFHRIEVIEVAEEFVEAVHRRQELVAVAQMVLAELAGGVTTRLQHVGDGGGLGRQADRGAGLADRGHAGADRQLAGDEVGASRRAARLGVIIGEQHALGGDLVEIRRPPGHQAAVVGADVPHADVVTHDDDDVGPLWRCLRDRGRGRPQSDRDGRSEQPRQERSLFLSAFSHRLPPWLRRPERIAAGPNATWAHAGARTMQIRQNQPGGRSRVAKGASPNSTR